MPGDVWPPAPPPSGDGRTRRQFLRGAVALAGAAVVGGGVVEGARLLGGKNAPAAPGSTSGGSPTPGASASASSPPTATLRSTATEPQGGMWSFRSAPSVRLPVFSGSGGLVGDVPVMVGVGSAKGLKQGVAAGQPAQGPLVMDPSGDPIWFQPLTGTDWATNVRPATYRGNRVMVWWRGIVVSPGFGQGEVLLWDTSYRQVARVVAGNGMRADLHEALLTDRGTVLMSCFPVSLDANLSPYGGPTSGKVLNGLFQEVDVSTGKVLLDWRGEGHVAFDESYLPAKTSPWDYMHLNSVAPFPDGSLLVSCRHTWTLYKVNRSTGAIIWRLGGKHSDFEIGPGANFAWQHHAVPVSNTRITIFDNGSRSGVFTESQSRGLIVDLDTGAMKATLVRALTTRPSTQAIAMGSVQIEPDGRYFMGWGTAGSISEFGPAGIINANQKLTDSCFTYRAFRYPWAARPNTAPAVAAETVQGVTRVYASWNGATDVAFWRVHAGPSPQALEIAGTAARRGFETVIEGPATAAYVAVDALDAAGGRLGASATVRVS